MAGRIIWQDINEETEARFMAGAVSSLTMPESHLVEYQRNGSKPSQEDFDAKGYQFVWGQLIKSVCEEEGARFVTWEVRFDQMHAEFLARGGNGEELADIGIEVAGRFCKSGLKYLYIDDSSLNSTDFAFILSQTNKEKQAREWICNRLLKGDDKALMNKMLMELFRINLSIAHAEAKRRKLLAKQQAAIEGK